MKMKAIEPRGAASLAPPGSANVSTTCLKKSLPREVRFQPSETSSETILLSFSKGFVNLPVIG